VNASHFGGFSDDEKEPDRKRSKAEVMKEVMAKSKFHKYERQKQKEEDNDVADELDAQLDDIRSLLFANDPNVHPSRRPQKDDYDLAVRQLAEDRRAQATDRLKTEEEILAEQKKKQELLEVGYFNILIFLDGKRIKNETRVF
jgi:nucleolar protein 14